jgi:hypothetical protein
MDIMLNDFTADTTKGCLLPATIQFNALIGLLSMGNGISVTVSTTFLY